MTRTCGLPGCVLDLDELHLRADAVYCSGVHRRDASRMGLAHSAGGAFPWDRYSAIRRQRAHLRATSSPTNNSRAVVSATALLEPTEETPSDEHDHRS